jgi:hypothetical protein
MERLQMGSRAKCKAMTRRLAAGATSRQTIAMKMAAHKTREHAVMVDRILTNFGVPRTHEQAEADKSKYATPACMRREVMLDDMVLEWLRQHLNGGASYEIARGIGAGVMPTIEALNALERRGAIMAEQQQGIGRATSPTTIRYNTVGPIYRLSFEEWVMSRG